MQSRNFTLTLAAVVALGVVGAVAIVAGNDGSPSPVTAQEKARPAPTQPPAEPVMPAPIDPNDPDAARIHKKGPVRSHSDASFTYGGHTFTVPRKGDPEWADYQEMLKWRRSLSPDNLPTYALPYDPEWRAESAGRRQVEERSIPLMGGFESMGDLAQFVLSAVEGGDRSVLSSAAVDRPEFELLLWPEFPQSRPYAKIPVGEAWGFMRSESGSGADKLLRVHGHKKLELDSITVEKVTEFTNFKLHRGVQIRALDTAAQEYVYLDFVKSIVQSEEQFKVFLYTE